VPGFWIGELAQVGGVKHRVSSVPGQSFRVVLNSLSGKCLNTLSEAA